MTRRGTLLVCPDCGDVLTRSRIQLVDGSWVFGWICDCTPETRGDVSNTNIPFEQWEAERMQDPEFRAAVEASEEEYQKARAKIMEELNE